MKKIAQVALAALILGIGSASVYANETQRGPSPHKPHKPGKHGCGDKCDGKIDIVLDVVPHCDLDVLEETITLAQASNGNWTGTSAFNVRTNKGYKLDIYNPPRLTGPAGSVPVEVTTRQQGASQNYKGGYLRSTGNEDVKFYVKAIVDKYDYENADAGKYQGTYKVAVKF